MARERHERRAGRGIVSERDENGKRAAIYTRVSSQRQEDGVSLEAQEQACRTYCDSNGWEVAQVFREVQSAWAGERPELGKLMARLPMYDAFVCYRVDRASRSVADFCRMFDDCQEAETELVSVMEGFDSGKPFGRTLMRVLVVFAEMESDNTSQRVATAKAHQVANGIVPWKAKYGYRRGDDDRPEAEPEEAEVVIRVFHERGMDRKLADIADGLNADGLTRRGARWRYHHVSRILHDMTYRGVYVCGRKRRRGKAWVDVPKGAQRRIAGLFPTLVSEAVWDFAHHRRDGRRPTKPAVFRAVLVCGLCGEPFHVVSARPPRRTTAYRCHGRHDLANGCPASQIPEPRVKELVGKELQAIAAGERELLVEARRAAEGEIVLARRERLYSRAQAAYTEELLEMEGLRAAKVERDAAQATVRDRGARPGTASEKAGAATTTDTAFRLADAGKVEEASRMLRQGFTRIRISADRAELVASLSEIDSEIARDAAV